MGQRLNLEIIQEGETSMNIYFHWSAYTSCALNCAENWLQEYMKLRCIHEPIKGFEEQSNVVRLSSFEMAVRASVAMGAGFNQAETERVKLLTLSAEPTDELKIIQKIAASDFPCSDRNDGLISITVEGVEETEGWEEGRVSIDIDEETVCFDVCWAYESEKELLESQDVRSLEELADENDYMYEAYKNAPVLDIDLDSIPWDDFSSVANEIQNLYCWKTPSGTIIQAIE